MRESHARTANTVAEETPALLEPVAQARRAAGPRAAHTGRFHLVYALVLAAAVGVIALGIHAATGVTHRPHAVVQWHPKGGTPLATAKTIAKHYTDLKLPGFEATSSPTVTAQRAGEVGLGAIQIPYGDGLAQIALPPSDTVYVVSGHGEGSSLIEPPTLKRELRLRRLALGLVVDTFSSRHPPKHVFVKLPSSGGLLLVYYGRDEFNDALLRKFRALLARMAAAKKSPARDIQLLTAVTSGSVFEVKQQVLTEDAKKRVIVMEPRPCYDAACPSTR